MLPSGLATDPCGSKEIIAGAVEQSEMMREILLARQQGIVLVIPSLVAMVWTTQRMILSFMILRKEKMPTTAVSEERISVMRLLVENFRPSLYPSMTTNNPCAWPGTPRGCATMVTLLV